MSISDITPFGGNAQEAVSIIQTPWGKVRIVKLGGQELAVLADVCRLVDREPKHALDNVPATEHVARGDFNSPLGIPGNSPVNFVTVEGALAIIDHSRKPNAPQIESFIRQHLALAPVTGERLKTSLQVMMKMTPVPALQLIQDLAGRAITVERDRQRLITENKAATARVRELKPQATFGAAVSRTDGDMTITQLGKLMCDRHLINKVRDVFTLLASWHQIYRDYFGHWVASEVARKKGWMREIPEIGRNKQSSWMTARVTAAGAAAYVEKRVKELSAGRILPPVGNDGQVNA